MASRFASSAGFKAVVKEPEPETTQQVVEAELEADQPDAVLETAHEQMADDAVGEAEAKPSVVEVPAAELLDESAPIIATQSADGPTTTSIIQEVEAEPVTVSAVEASSQPPAEPEVATPTAQEVPVSEPEGAAPMSAEPEEPVIEEMPLAADIYRVQIAALRSEELAIDYWRRASTRRPALMAGIVRYIQRADLGAKGIYYRVQLGNFEDRTSANAFCRELKETELSCYVVKTP